MLQLILLSCEFETGHGTDDGSYEQSFLYIYNLADSSLSFLTEGESPVLMPDRNEILYLFASSPYSSSELSTYDYVNNLMTTVRNHNYYFKSNMVSPDYNYIVFAEGNGVHRININTSERETLVRDPSSRLDTQPSYSSDGRQLIYLTTPLNETGRADYDSVYVHLFSFDSYEYKTLDTLFRRGNSVFTAGFINGSEMFYICRVGYNSNHIYEIKYYVYSNGVIPKLQYKKSFFPFDYQKYIRSISDKEILIVDRKKVTYYNFITNSQKILENFSKYDRIIERVKNSENLIGAFENSMAIMNLNGEVEKEIFPDIEDKIMWANYDYEDGKIIFMVTRWLAD